ncbi:MAG: tetratricopeptide repeat protein [Okeania sp. SIO3B3]|nr:tetratricopeptide repeat protein [Okeania sp. SIO3B3]
MSAGQLLKQANRLKREGRLNEAITLYHQAIEINPNFAWTYYELGDALVKQDKFDTAVAYLQKAVELKCDFHFAYQELANVFQKQEKLDEAIRYYNLSLENQQTSHTISQTLISDKVYFDKVKSYQNSYETIVENGKWIDHPFYVSIETFSSCNAACNFCPYPSLERQGTKMSENLFEKIVNELSSREGYALPLINLSRVNEPFLDKRIFDFINFVNSKLPKTKIQYFTNASVLDDKKLEKLLSTKNTNFLKISFNDYRPKEYEEVMRIPFDRTYRNVKHIHDRKLAGDVNFSVRLGRVGDGTTADNDFLKWAKKVFPLFEAVVTPRFDWIGKVKVPVFPILGIVGCFQWFELHFLSNGKEAFCCIDSDGVNGRGDANYQNVFDIYNHPYRKSLRLQKISRKDVGVCSKCSALA